ncbi:MAG: ribose-phosphate diphosphokinase [Deltaproteobacteria bacterium]|jgi:ribose-phosphate pyrophosphokinase|nr:ribose-phosphate diphosphokinase [Deltaproteobacteria bacterium]MBW2532663.1 ribose-phosphate diphosphokinase [Deltaproteobacteria bacterium]
MTDSRRLLHSISSYEYLAGALAPAGGYERGRIERKTFPDGERYLRILGDPRGRDVVLLGGTPTDADALELFDLGCGLFREGARTLSIVIPYFGYSTMERALRPGEVVTAKTRAQLISAIPPCEGGTRVVLFDLHTDGIEFYFSDLHVTHHVHGGPLVARMVERLVGDRPYVLGATDAGRAKWVESLARHLGCEPAFVYKRRDASSGALAVTGINADVTGRIVVIYDDMIRTGSSLKQAAAAYRDAGATDVHAIASHLVLPGDALDGLLSSGLITSVSGTNSHPASAQAEARGGIVECLAPLLAAAIEQA